MKRVPSPHLFTGLLALSLIAGLGFAYMQYGSLTAAQSEVERLRKENADEKAVRKRLVESQVKLDEALAALKHVQLEVPQREFLPTMLKDLEQVGQSHGVKVLGVKPLAKKSSSSRDKKSTSSSKARKPYTELDVEVKGTGGFEQVYAFMSALKSFPKIAELRSVSISPRRAGNEGGSTLELTANMRAYVFTRPETKKVEKTTQVSQKTEPSQPLSTGGVRRGDG